jgi:hypothetical protein
VLGFYRNFLSRALPRNSGVGGVKHVKIPQRNGIDFSAGYLKLGGTYEKFGLAMGYQTPSYW